MNRGGGRTGMRSIREILRSLGPLVAGASDGVRWQEAWAAAAGSAAAASSRVLSLRTGTLVVETESQALYAELSGWRNAEIRARCQAAFGEPVRSLRIRPAGA